MFFIHLIAQLAQSHFCFVFKHPYLRFIFNFCLKHRRKISKKNFITLYQLVTLEFPYCGILCNIRSSSYFFVLFFQFLDKFKNFIIILNFTCGCGTRAGSSYPHCNKIFNNNMNFHFFKIHRCIFSQFVSIFPVFIV